MAFFGQNCKNLRTSLSAFFSINQPSQRVCVFHTGSVKGESKPPSTIQKTKYQAWTFRVSVWFGYFGLLLGLFSVRFGQFRVRSGSDSKTSNRKIPKKSGTHSVPVQLFQVVRVIQVKYMVFGVKYHVIRKIQIKTLDISDCFGYF